MVLDELIEEGKQLKQKKSALAQKEQEIKALREQFDPLLEKYKELSKQYAAEKSGYEKQLIDYQARVASQTAQLSQLSSLAAELGLEAKVEAAPAAPAPTPALYGEKPGIGAKIMDKLSQQQRVLYLLSKSPDAANTYDCITSSLKTSEKAVYDLIYQLKKKGMVTSPKRGIYKLTEKGIGAAKNLERAAVEAPVVPAAPEPVPAPEVPAAPVQPLPIKAEELKGFTVVDSVRYILLNADRNVSKSELDDMMPDKDNAIRVALSVLKKDGYITHPSKGVYRKTEKGHRNFAELLAKYAKPQAAVQAVAPAPAAAEAAHEITAKDKRGLEHALGLWRDNIPATAEVLNGFDMTNLMGTHMYEDTINGKTVFVPNDITDLHKYKQLCQIIEKCGGKINLQETAQKLGMSTDDVKTLIHGVTRSGIVPAVEIYETGTVTINDFETLRARVRMAQDQGITSITSSDLGYMTNLSQQDLVDKKKEVLSSLEAALKKEYPNEQFEMRPEVLNDKLVIKLKKR